MTKRADLTKQIAKAAKRQGVEWALLREGGRHTIYALGGQSVAIPRHNEINEITAESIRKQAGETLGKDWWKR
ncbi:type II toxin-antitoxin system HicA family toxin [Demetria terragena]|uniref:type II toxin-antitoxin system HicA family toxin n=1 Tax=Demetria terragena TaxID=63959 RepID=UPI000374513F|nr:type II toxin-antitoxin system HicA family toxin [Demetria terragena]